ncbi:MAG: hypothetical protein QOI56_983 [Actinomycetota bacterium]|nr:hypothetical protein [Actinomycetota bacterium]
MPWCETCSTYVADDELDAEGACPTCHEVVGEPHRTPWHFKLLVVTVALYLGWRTVQGITWVVHHL